jgi:hypothetical protein
MEEAWERLLDLLAAGAAEEAEDLARQLRRNRQFRPPLEPEVYMNPEERMALEFLEQNLPREYREFIEALTDHPGERPNMLAELLERYQHAMDLRREHPEAFEREIELRQLEGEAWAIGERLQHTGSEEEQAALEKELRQILNRIFDMRQEQRRTQIEHMRKELEELEESVKKLDDNRDKAIQKKFNEMTGREDELDFM